jgi:type 1 fimbria pilin
MSFRSIFFATILVASLLFFASLAHAQVGTTEAQLNGTVVDQTGGSVSKATIALRNVDTNRVNTPSPPTTPATTFSPTSCRGAMR